MPARRVEVVLTVECNLQSAVLLQPTVIVTLIGHLTWISNLSCVVFFRDSDHAEC